MSEEKKTVDVKPKETKRKPSKRATKEESKHPADTRKTCAVCGKKSDKMFASVGKDWVCCPACLARYGVTR